MFSSLLNVLVPITIFHYCVYFMFILLFVCKIVFIINRLFIFVAKLFPSLFDRSFYEFELFLSIYVVCFINKISLIFNKMKIVRVCKNVYMFLICFCIENNISIWPQYLYLIYYYFFFLIVYTVRIHNENT